ncbi:hypothetical protein CSV80_14585 [Sporosarcina sp. P12(2017)]|uniref:hypothetical protein n=1 Tax=unclassified Sporosarcina TaxID=2647733 RepID=UPI000C170DA3|nr:MULTISPECIES: hypothetical protein [unclassified Sporosarcina]PIC56470.1 hypothetical protein CSV81_14450 [Sporosarcina sp. P10]PIC59767.1 hypothetical protein CSV80_14585 [Sporosarcina sp. P12(2017)]
MVNKNPSKSYKWREKYGAFITASVCLYCLLINWGHNWFLEGFFGIGVLICGAIGVSDVKKVNSSK